ncbi:hypothetical protein Kpol_1058p32 [Vanderwaltozyma polyspora DSM 70294]|uniref:Proteasome activator BLM10 n=1 Tax=Vanderwaltozyma polyspora (strain ATCC 22028 / DSM 70294 / BCRC 21397 / CBS 2163 / NBRC 10782 / NRRL Y-8283 / UCD 57-17) TaxID=436907 RepID=A7TJR6_VANPO|nr:uncharacterized protein Kpol_1058p32 [Vanderwaltozyma polyspora DSM 70294]EDO17495.1 hypothetical protein Kpol_1058p32 [Vanderwaltozyma polyspora DSM 70294]
MNSDGLKAPIPVRKTPLRVLRDGVGLHRPRSSIGLAGLNDNVSSTNIAKVEFGRAQSATPTKQKLFNGMDAEDIVQERLHCYGLDYPVDMAVFDKKKYDRNSKWFSRDKKPLFPVKDCLPYETETHLDQASYMCHVLVNLYIAIGSMDLQGLIAISSKDLASLKQEVDNLALNTDLFRFNHYAGDAVSPVNFYINDEEALDEEFLEQMGSEQNSRGKITAISATIINLNHWANELKNCLSFDFPLTLRKSLATVFYYLSLVRGQKLNRHMCVDLFEYLVSTDDHGTNFTDLLVDLDLTLNHKILFDFLLEFLPYPDSDYVKMDISSREDQQLFKLFLRLAHVAKPFFKNTGKDIMKQSMDNLLSSLAPSTMSVVLPMITACVPYYYQDDNTISDYFPFFFSLWGSVTATVALDTHMYDFVGTVLEDSYWKHLKGDECSNHIDLKKYGLLTDEQLDFMFNRLQSHLRSDGQIHSYSRTIKPFIYAINGSDSDDYFAKLSALIKSIETYVHPSNNGFWTKPLAKFVHAFIKSYHERVKKEERLELKNQNDVLVLNSANHSKLLSLVVDILFSGSQNKNENVANYYISCFAYLLNLFPENSHIIFDRVLKDLSSALSGEYVNSRHRILSSLKQFTRIIRYMVEDRLYRVHITNILSTLVTKIDTNDLSLVSNIFNAIVSIASFIPLENFVRNDEYFSFASHTLPFIEQHFYSIKADEEDYKFEYDEEFLDLAFRSSTTIFEGILTDYVEKIFLLVNEDLEDGFVTKINNTTMILIEDMDDTIFETFSQHFEKQFWKIDSFGDSSPNYELVTIPLAAIVKRNSSFSNNLVKQLMYNIELQIQKGAGSVRSSSKVQRRDFKLVLYLTALNDVLRESRSAILDFSDELIEFMRFLYTNITNPPLDMITSIIVHNVLASLTTTEVVEYQMFSETSDIPQSERWGGLQFDKRKFTEENLNFKWYVPSNKEIETVLKIMTSILDLCETNMKEFMNTSNYDTASVDRIQKYILIMTHVISGSSLLFDPDFNKNKSKPPSEMTYNERLLLLKNLRENRCDDEELDIDIEPIREDSGDHDYYESHYSDDGIGGVEMAEPSVDQLILDDPVDISETPSVISTPVPGQHVDMSSSAMNSNLVFRDIDIFSCNYLFGRSIEDKFQSPEYFKVHKLRAIVGKLFHKLFINLSQNFENNTMIFQVLLHGMKVWFTDIGQETIFTDDSSACLDMDFIENIQNISQNYEPFTRTCLALKANSYHHSRVLLHSTNRWPSKLEKIVLRDIFQLAISVYPDVYRPAQGTLIHCMKQLIGSYAFVIKNIVESLNSSLKLRDNMKIEVILKLMMIKKVHHKLMSDYRNMEKVVLLLIECSKIKELEIAVYAEKILTDFVTKLKIPSSVCIFDNNILLSLAPPDNSINIQVDAVKAAKSKKREFIFLQLFNLQDKLIDILDNVGDLNWRVTVFLIRFISRVQTNLETKLAKRAINVIFKQTLSKHPEIIRVSIRSIISITNKIFALSDYKYDISKAFESSFDPDFISNIDTRANDFSESFRKEFDNFDQPTYYIDSKAFKGWLCWGPSMKVVNSKTIEVDLRNSEIEVLKELGSLLTKDWLQNIITHFIQDNETKSVLSSGNVSFFVLTLFILTRNFSEVTLNDYFDICLNTYNRYDKASMITSLEIFTSLITGSKYMESEDLILRDTFVEKYLDECLGTELNHDTYEIWNTVCWWLPTIVDIRRCPPFYQFFSNFESMMKISSDAPAEQASKILMFRSILISMEFRSPDMLSVFNFLSFNHPYDHVRESIAKLFSTIIQNTSNPSLSSPDLLIQNANSKPDGLGVQIKRMPKVIDEFIKKQFKNILKEVDVIENMTPQEILKTPFFYMSSTMCYWMKEVSRGPNKMLLVPYAIDYIQPFLINLIKHKDVCKLAGIDPSLLYVGLAYIPIRKEDKGKVVHAISNDSLMETSNQKQLQLSLVQHFFSSQLLQLENEDKNKIFEFVVHNLFNEQFIEVRLRAADVLSDIIHNIGDSEEVQKLIEKFDHNLGKYSMEKRKKLSKTNVKIHGSIVGLGAIISAFPYIFPLPDWIPIQLGKLTEWARTNGPAGTAAKNIISKFKKVRTDTWLFDKEKFTPDQIEDLEGVLWRSYYA